MNIMNINQFTYNGKRSYDDFCLIITETPPFVIAERDITFDSINGRSGDLLTDNGRYKNVQKEYKVAALTDDFSLPLLVKKIASWLISSPNYYILSDTYDPNYFWYACYAGKTSVVNKLLKLGTATLKFNCKPYKYSFEGQNPITIAAPGAIWNPEDLESAPYMKITGSGNITLTVNGNDYIFRGVDGYIEIDSETMNAYKGSESQNTKMYTPTFPTLARGNNVISWTGSVTKVEMIPRWCCL